MAATRKRADFDRDTYFLYSQSEEKKIKDTITYHLNNTQVKAKLFYHGDVNKSPVHHFFDNKADAEQFLNVLRKIHNDNLSNEKLSKELHGLDSKALGVDGRKLDGKQYYHVSVFRRQFFALQEFLAEKNEIKDSKSVNQPSSSSAVTLAALGSDAKSLEKTIPVVKTTNEPLVTTTSVTPECDDDYVMVNYDDAVVSVSPKSLKI